MPKTKISEFSSTPANNTDIDSINIAEGCAPSGINDAIRELMAQLKDFQTGAVGDSFNGPVGSTTASTGAFTTLSASSTVTLSGGTANGVTYLNGSKVVTSGSALTFDGSKIALNTATSNIQLTTSVNTNQAYISLADADGRTAVFRSPNSGAPNCAQIGTVTNHETAFLYGNSEQMRLTSTGLGIGTSSPSFKLDLNGIGAVRAGNAIRYYRTDNAIYTELYDAGSSGFTLNNANGNGFRFQSAGSTQATLDSSGNLGLGVTPSAWSGMKAFQLGDGTFAMSSDGAGAGDGSLTWNGYYNGTNWIYGYTGGGANRFRLNESGAAWFTAPSGTAGNAITFTQAMTLDASGNLGIGITSLTQRFQVEQSQNASTWGYFTNGSNGAGAAVGILLGTDQGTAGALSQNSSNAGYGASANALRLRNLLSAPITFETNGSERARIDSSGRFLVYAQTAGGLGVTIDGDSGSAPYFIVNSNSSSGAPAYFRYQGTTVGSITTTTTTTSYNITSDQRLKENIQDADSASSLIDSLQVRQFDWKADGNHQRYGFVAQELVTVAPEAVHQPTDTEEMMAVDYSKLVPMLVKEIQSLRQRVAQLESN